MSLSAVYPDCPNIHLDHVLTIDVFILKQVTSANSLTNLQKPLCAL